MRNKHETVDVYKFNYGNNSCDKCEYWDGFNLIGECDLNKKDTMRYNSCGNFKDKK
ncbi:MAG: hypothetical protein ACRDDY_06190 [Clostridium sp.]|uniref:hypothetical protein n=1 Tax=Clostridium sp. TaxID=1506 RepID=UPI003EE68A5C